MLLPCHVVVLVFTAFNECRKVHNRGCETGHLQLMPKLANFNSNIYKLIRLFLVAEFSGRQLQPSQFLPALVIFLGTNNVNAALPTFSVYGHVWDAGIGSALSRCPLWQRFTEVNALHV